MPATETVNLSLSLCPRCDGQTFDVGSCPVCRNTGLLDGDGDPFQPPPPFDRWTPAALVRLTASEGYRPPTYHPPQADTNRGRITLAPTTPEPTPPADRPTKRLTLSEIVELQLHALARTSTDYSSVRLTRNAKGETQIEVFVREGADGTETLEDVTARAREVYDNLREQYPTEAGS